MAAESLVITDSPLESTQVSKASAALLKHITTDKTKALAGSKKNLFAEEDGQQDSEDSEEDVPLWLILTTKHHIIDKSRLKPEKIPVPHSLHSAPSRRILLITAEPQRAYKDLIAHPSFPTALSSKISRVIDVAKLKSKYKSFEQKRQLAAEHDVFLADDRILPFLPGIMGKALYKTSSKRPIPVRLTGKEKHERLADNKRRPKDTPRLVGSATDVAKDIEKALNSALVHLSPSVSTAIKIGYASWSASQIKENVEALVPQVVGKLVPKKWSNVKSIHIKGPETAALPIYLSEELWVDEGDVIEEPYVEKLKDPKKGRASRRLLLSDGNVKDREASQDHPPSREKKRKVEDGSVLDQEIALRKTKLKKQRDNVMGKTVDDL